MDIVSSQLSGNAHFILCTWYLDAYTGASRGNVYHMEIATSAPSVTAGDGDGEVTLLSTLALKFDKQLS